MSYRKQQMIVKPNTRLKSKLNRMNGSPSPISGQGVGANYSSPLPEIYSGHTQRIPRYSQYQQMDEDADINGSLDTIADFCTQTDENTGRLFEINFNREPSNVEVKILNDVMRKWTKTNEFGTRLWRMFRSTLMYGDQFFIRDPETLKWMWVDPANVEKVLVNESNGKKIEAFIIRDLDINNDMLTASDPNQYGVNQIGLGTNTLQNNSDPSALGGYGLPNHYNTGAAHMTAVAAEHVVHLSLSEGLDASWPFGTSFLESVYKPYRQKTLLEDAMLIYRIHRAPERRVFYIDTGSLPVHKANAYIERVKNETRQRRVPTRNGQGQSVTSTAYNPLCLSMFTKIPLLNGTSKTIFQLKDDYESGKENWTFSIDPETGKVVPGVITWAGITGTNKKVIDIKLSNGETLTCTPDHKIPVMGKGYVEAQDVSYNDLLFPFIKQVKKDVVSVYDNSLGKFIDCNEVIGGFFKNITKHQEFVYKDIGTTNDKNVIINRDGNIDNVDPRNLYFVTEKDAKAYYNDIIQNMYIKGIADQNAVDDIYIVEKSEPYEVPYVGTITIDGTERWHGNHNFATDCGIFVKNSMIEDYFFAVGDNGKGSKVTTLQGGDALSSIDDMRYFSNILRRGMRVPSSYLPSGPEDGQMTFNDGRVGTAYIQEYRFAEFCKRLQRLIAPVFDKEFKHYLAKTGFSIDEDLFDVGFNTPQHFTEYARVERDVAMINTFIPLAEMGIFSKRFLIERYLGLTKEEIAKNEVQWLEENPDAVTDEEASGSGIEAEAGTSSLPDLDSVGVRPDESVPDPTQDTDTGDTDDFGAGDMGTPSAPATGNGEMDGAAAGGIPGGA